MLRSLRADLLWVHASPRLCRGFSMGNSSTRGKDPRQSRGLTVRGRETRAQQIAVRGRETRAQHRGAFTLVEMLVAMAITLVMMAAVVTLFANVSGSVRNRRATTEMSGQLRHVRNMLQQDLQGATCPGMTWQRPESNHGYIELIEGPYREGNASILIDGVDNAQQFNPEIDHETSILPSSNLDFRSVQNQSRWATDGGGLGDYDDTLMLTVRNEHEPFVGRMPVNVRPNDRAVNRFDRWQHTTAESTLAEVVWFAVENPAEGEDPDNFFGEPGMRTIYRRALLIAPWVNPYRFVDPRNGQVTDTFVDGGDRFKAQPGLVRMLPSGILPEQALAALVAFQERYDLSVRLEWDHNIGSEGRWKIVANTLGDLTKRENRYEHHFYRPTTSVRDYPYAALSVGSGYGSNPPVICTPDPETPTNLSQRTEGRGNIQAGLVLSYSLAIPMPPDENDLAQRQIYPWRPFAFVDDDSDTLATARVMLNDQGQVLRILHGFVPLSNQRRGEDVMMTNALGFDIRVYDPGAPLFGHRDSGTVLEPADPGWPVAYLHNDNMGSGFIGNNTSASAEFPFIGQGAYVDLGYGFDTRNVSTPELPFPQFAPAFSSSVIPWFFIPRALCDVYYDSRPSNLKPLSQLAPGYAVYDTWSFHYENNGINEDRLRLEGGTWREVDTSIDEGTNGIEDPGNYTDAYNVTRLGVDDVGERETVPPYDKPLRGVQVILRAYEPDSRAIRQVRVNQHFMPE